MVVRLARSGFRAGGEFWGCGMHFESGCRGSREVPDHEWDWFGFAPVPVRIIANHERWLAECEREDYVRESDYYHGRYYVTIHGVAGPYFDDSGYFGSYDSYDEDDWALELALDGDVQDPYLDCLEDEAADSAVGSINQILVPASTDLSMGARTVAAARDCVSDRHGFDELCRWLTVRFAGSMPVRLGERDSGVVELEDRSLLVFSRTESGILLSSCGGYRLLCSSLDPATAVLSQQQFEQLAGYFAKNFGLDVAASTSWWRR